jgi:hypothetical protein
MTFCGLRRLKKRRLRQIRARSLLGGLKALPPTTSILTRPTPGLPSQFRHLSFLCRVEHIIGSDIVLMSQKTSLSNGRKWPQ